MKNEKIAFVWKTKECMFSKKYVIFYLILLFLLTRLYVLFAGLENILTKPPGDELYQGTVAKMFLEGSIDSILDYQHGDHNGFPSMEIIPITLFFYIFGCYLIPLKLVPMTFILLTMVLWFLFVRKYIDHKTAVLASLLFIFAPPFFANFNFVVGSHAESLFFDILGLTLFFKMIEQKKRLLWYILFGLVSGFAMWYDVIFSIMLFTCMLLWFIKDRLFFLNRNFVWFIVSFLIGFSIWFYYHCVLNDFKTITALFKYSEAYPKIGFFVKLKDFFTWGLPYSTCFKDTIFLNGNWLAYFYYFVFLCCFVGICWWQREYILNVVQSFISGKFQTTQRVAVKVEIFFLCFILIFIFVFCVSRFPVDYKSSYFFSYKYLLPLYPFIFVTTAIGLTTLPKSGRKYTKVVSLLLIFITLLSGGIGLVNQISIRDFGKGLRFQGYSYKSLVYYIWKQNNRGKIPGVEPINKLNNIGDNELYKNFLCTQGMYGLVIINKFEPIVCSSLISGISQKFHHNCYEGVGSAYSFLYRDISTLIEKCNLIDEIYKKYAYYGGATSLPVGGDIDKHISAISQIDSRFQPYFYQGLGIQLARKMSLADVNRVLLQIDPAIGEYCCIGIGQNTAGRFEWAFADKEYHVGFDGLNKDYWHDCYYGFGWGIGDFFEFDTDRYTAIINNNISPEYMEYCLKGLSDRLRWKFGSDDKKLQKLLNLIPVMEYFVLDGNTIRFYDESQRKYLIKGWSFTEEWGTWSEGKESLIIVNFKGLNETLEHDDEILRSAQNDSMRRAQNDKEGTHRARDYTMHIKATGFSVPGKQQSVRIYLDDNLLGEHTFTHPATYFEDIEIKIPSAYIKEGNQRIRFVYSFTGVPAEYGMGPDIRQLAMGVSSIEFR